MQYCIPYNDVERIDIVQHAMAAKWDDTVLYASLMGLDEVVFNTVITGVANTVLHAISMGLYRIQY